MNHSIVLLHGASRPTVLHIKDGRYVVNMLATPEPTTDGGPGSWTTFTEALFKGAVNVTRFRLNWYPFRELQASKLSRYTLTSINVATQCEAMIESLRDQFNQCLENSDNHDCSTWLCYSSISRAISRTSRLPLRSTLRVYTKQRTTAGSMLSGCLLTPT
jgi:hypothetical protein